MTMFRALLIAMLAVIVGYTSVVASNHGMNFFPVYNADVLAMAWPGPV